MTKVLASSLLVVLLLAQCSSLYATSYEDIAFIILTQPNSYHMSLASRLKKEIITQAIEYQQIKTPVWITHSQGSWVVLPLLEKIMDKYEPNVRWVVFCDQHTSFNLINLDKVLSEFDHSEEIWIGHALKDIEPTIIHHFAYANNSDEFLYPNFGSGFVMSISLLHSLYRRFNENEIKSNTEFSIDPAFELAQFVWNNGKGSMLKHSDEFCIVSNQNCATYPKSHDTCGDPIAAEAILFAVKTYHKFHKSRVEVVKNTWGRFTSHLLFFSNKNDTTIPTINLGIKNTQRGHCAKTVGILNYLNEYLKNFESIKWVVIADDDTILSVSRLCEILSCYGPNNLALGERYGFNILTGKGYDYLTGGGGLVLSVDLIPKLASCVCPMPSSPDDMLLGVCLAKLKIPVIHSPLFHQARPMDYALEYLAPHRPISFHKHWMVDPIEVYRQWFESDDSRLSEKVSTQGLYHSEL